MRPESAAIWANPLIKVSDGTARPCPCHYAYSSMSLSLSLPLSLLVYRVADAAYQAYTDTGGQHPWYSPPRPRNLHLASGTLLQQRPPPRHKSTRYSSLLQPTHNPVFR